MSVQKHTSDIWRFTKMLRTDTTGQSCHLCTNLSDGELCEHCGQTLAWFSLEGVHSCLSVTVGWGHRFSVVGSRCHYINKWCWRTEMVSEESGSEWICPCKTQPTCNWLQVFYFRWHEKSHLWMARAQAGNQKGGTYAHFEDRKVHTTNVSIAIQRNNTVGIF